MTKLDWAVVVLNVFAGILNLTVFAITGGSWFNLIGGCFNLAMAGGLVLFLRHLARKHEGYW